MSRVGLDKLNLFLICSLIITSIFRFDLIGQVSLIDLMIVLTGVVTFPYIIISQKKIGKYSQIILASLLVAVSIELAHLLGNYSFNQLRSTLFRAEFLIVVVSSISVLKDNSSSQYVLYSLLIAGIILSALTILSYYGVNDLGHFAPFRGGRWIGTNLVFGQAGIYLNSALAVSISYTLVGINKRKIAWTITLLVCSCFLVWSIYLLKSRSTYLGTVGVITVILVAWPTHSRILKGFIISSISITLYLVFVPYFDTLIDIIYSYGEVGIRRRLNMYSVALDEFASAPLFGHGAHYFPSIFKDKALHSRYLSQLISVGVVGLMAEILVFFVAIYRGLVYNQTRSNGYDSTSVDALIGLGILSCSLIEFFFSRGLGSVPMYTAVALLVSTRYLTTSYRA